MAFVVPLLTPGVLSTGVRERAHHEGCGCSWLKGAARSHPKTAAPQPRWSTAGACSCRHPATCSSCWLFVELPMGTSVPWDPGCLHEKKVWIWVVWGAAASTSRLPGGRKPGQVTLERELSQRSPSCGCGLASAVG